MNTPHTCPKCGALLPADAPEGLCPACLMLGGIPTGAPTLKMTPSQKPGAPQPAVTPSPEELAPYFPNLEILDLLGRGGMGMVFKARQKNLNRLVALKILPVEPDADEHFAERFQREAQALARLNHPNIVSVFDFGEAKISTGSADSPVGEAQNENAKPADKTVGAPSLFYFLMEFVDGANLRTLIRSGEMKPEAALALIPAFCDALQYAHDEGVVHRDIKPENVLVDKKGRVKIADFGLAKLLGHDAHDHTLTRTGMSLGTPRYMAPEQMDKPETVDHRADIYSLGVVFYEMLTGDLPMGRFPLPSQKVQVDVRFDEIVLHALEKEPSLRYQQASQIKTDVQNVTGAPKPAAAAAPLAPPVVPDSIHVDEAKPDAVAPLPRRFWWRAFGLLMLGWFGVGALWNLRIPGCLLGSLILSGITMEIAIRHVSRKSRWAREWREASAFKRVFFTSGYVALGVIPFMMLLGALHAKWEISSLHWNFSANSPAEFEAAHKDKEYELIRSLDAFKADVPTTELKSSGFSWHSGINVLGEGGPFLGYYGTSGILLSVIGGLVILLLFFQQVAGAERVSVWRLVLEGWRPAVEFTLTVLASAVCAYGILTTVFIYRNMPAHHFHNNDFSMSVKVVNASAKQVEFALNKWAVENNYAIGDEHSWNLTTVPRGQVVAQTAIFNAWKPSPFDRWHMTWTGMRHVSPHVAAHMTGTEKPPQSFVTLSAKMNLLDTGDEEQVKRVMKSMEDAINNASKLDAGKPLEPQITMITDGSDASNGMSGWWLIAGVVGLSIAWTKLRFSGTNRVAAPREPSETSKSKEAFRCEAWWFSRPPGVQKLMGILLGVVLVISLIAFLTFNMTTTTTADHSGVVRNLRDFTVGAGDPWLYLLHHKTGTRGGFESGMNLIAGSALFGYAVMFAGLALTRLTREQKRRGALSDVSTDTPQRKFFWNAVVAAVLFIAGIVGVIVHEVRNDGNGGLLADAVHEVHPDFTRPGITSIALKKAIADELKLSPEQVEKIDQSLNRAYFDFLKLENEHSSYRSENGHLVKLIKPFPDRSFELAKRLAIELSGIAGKPIIDEPERNAVWKLRLFRHAGEFDVRAELWEKDGKFHREESWMHDGKKITGGKSGDTLTDINLAFGHYIVDWEAKKDIIHEPRTDDASSSYTLGPDVVPFIIERIRNGELARMMAVREPDTVAKSGNPHAALVTQAGTSLGRACAEEQLKIHGIPFAKDATPEDLVKKLEALLGGTGNH